VTRIITPATGKRDTRFRKVISAALAHNFDPQPRIMIISVTGLAGELPPCVKYFPLHDSPRKAISRGQNCARKSLILRKRASFCFGILSARVLISQEKDGRGGTVVTNRSNFRDRYATTFRSSYTQPGRPLLPAPPLRLLPGGAIQFPGESILSLWTGTFSRRTVIAMLCQQS
jgi:hypothetical protein